MFRQPIAPIPEPVRQSSQLNGVAKSVARAKTLWNGSLVENAKSHELGRHRGGRREEQHAQYVQRAAAPPQIGVEQFVEFLVGFAQEDQRP
jgi:hypothetical protein